MRHLVRLVIAASTAGTLLALLVSVLAVTGRLHIDHYPALHTYGLSVGSASEYCYFDVVRLHPSAGCETSR
jgi:hypothetical protein